MPARLIESLATTAALAELFSDDSIVKAMLAFEAALARVEGALNIIPRSAAESIASVAETNGFNALGLAAETLRAGTPGIPLVKALTAHVGLKDPIAAGFVHWGATSQDVCDTALILLLKRAESILEEDLVRLDLALHRMAERSGQTVMLSRTLLQAAPPTTLGLKAAGWWAALQRCRVRLRMAFQECLVLQFGGASGTLAALGTRGIEVGKDLAVALKLGYPDAPWHTHRDRLATLVCACGVLTGSLGKIARDVSLLMQSEVAEAAEAAGEGRGGSSTMPHKRNPIGCSIALAAAARVPSLVSGFLTAMVQEHERAVGGWQAEWPLIAAVIQSAGVATASMADVFEGLIIDESRMRANIEATGGVIFAQRAMMQLSEKRGLGAAHEILAHAVNKSIEQGCRLSQILRDLEETKDQMDASSLEALEVPEQYLGVADEFRRRLLAPFPSGFPTPEDKRHTIGDTQTKEQE